MGIVSPMCSTSPLTRARRGSPRALAWLLFALFALAHGACGDADRMFTGRWLASAPLESDWLVGRPELVVGHFGPEVTGVAWFLDDDGIESRICPCTFIDHRAVNLDAATFVASTTFCDGSVWIWRLALDSGADPERLEGTVEVAGDPDRILDVSLELVDTFLPNEKKQCP